MFLPLGIAAVALAGIPAGFTRAPSLERPAAAIAGRTVAVLCTDDYSAWNKAKVDQNLSDSTGSFVWGFYDETADAIYIHPNGCRILKAEARGAKLTDRLSLQAGFATTLVHEAIHATGERDEAITECTAMHRVPGVLVRYFHVKPGKQLRSYMAAAWMVHRTEPAYYQTVC